MKIIRLCATGLIFTALVSGCSGSPEAERIDWATLCGGAFEGFSESEERGEGFLDRVIREKNVETSGNDHNVGSAGGKLLSSPRSSIEVCKLRSGDDSSETFETRFEWSSAGGLTPIEKARKKSDMDVLLVGDYAELRMPKNTLEAVDIYVKCDRGDVKTKFGMNSVKGTLRNKLFPELVDGAREVLVKMARIVLSNMNCANDVKLNSVYSEKVNWA